MAEEILDGAGKGNRAKVDSDQRLHVDAITFGRSELEVELGNGYNVNTGIINLTSANKSAVLYFKNDEDDDVIITSMFYIIGNSNSNGDTLVSVLKNPNTGTIITNAVACEMDRVNRNWGSSKTLEGVSYKGVEGDTFTNGDKVIESIVQSAKRTPLFVGDILLPKGTTIGFEITPPTGNTSMDIEMAFSCFIDTLKDTGE
jgi:hypothetical protein